MAQIEDEQTATPLERIRRYQEVLNDFGRAASETRQIDQLLQAACVQAARGIGLKHTKALRYRPASGDLLMEAGIGWKPGIVGRTALGTDIASPAGRALQSRQMVQIDDLPNEPGYRYSPVLREHGIISVLNVPIQADSVVWGVLEVDCEIPRHFGEDDSIFLDTLARSLGMAIQGLLSQQRAEEITAGALREAEQQRTLIRELIHRDKNDFQMVISMLLMQMSKQKDPEAINGFRHVIDRVSAISLAHDQLAMRPDQQNIDIAAYLLALCSSLGHRNPDIEIQTRLDTAELTRERAVSLGLITNELVTNAIKHAFPQGKGTIRVDFIAAWENGQDCLIVADDGVGMGPPRPGGSGLTLVKRLAQQIGGTLEQGPLDPGTRFQLCFLPMR